MKVGAMAQAREIESAVLRALELDGPSTMDELVRKVPGFTWIQVFAAVDRLNEVGKVVLRHLTPYDYVVWLGAGGEAERDGEDNERSRRS